MYVRGALKTCERKRVYKINTARSSLVLKLKFAMLWHTVGQLLTKLILSNAASKTEVTLSTNKKVYRKQNGTGFTILWLNFNSANFLLNQALTVFMKLAKPSGPNMPYKTIFHKMQIHSKITSFQFSETRVRLPIGHF